MFQLEKEIFGLEKGKFPIRNQKVFQLEKGKFPIRKKKIFQLEKGTYFQSDLVN